MNPSAIPAIHQQFYQLLEEAAARPRLGGTKAAMLLAFFNLPEIKTRWITSPASTALRFHHAFDGGLAVHTVEVFRTAQIVADALGEFKEVNNVGGWVFTPAPVGFVPYIDLLLAVCLHDLNKIGDAEGQPLYVPNMIKNGTVRSDKIPYATNDKLGAFANPDHHSRCELQADYLAQESLEWVPDGVQSLSLVKAYSEGLFAALSDDVKFAVIHHDGAYGKGRRLLTGNESPLQMILHFADMWSSRLNQEQYRG